MPKQNEDKDSKKKNHHKKQKVADFDDIVASSKDVRDQLSTAITSLSKSDDRESIERDRLKFQKKKMKSLREDKNKNMEHIVEI